MISLSFAAAKDINYKCAKERIYQILVVLGLMVDLRERYAITSNPERRFGRYGIMSKDIIPPGWA